YIEQRQKPFVLTLYPGGGFRVNEEWSDGVLERVCRSPFLHRMIVTQPQSHRYILHKYPQIASKVFYLYGGVIPRAAFERPNGRKHFGLDKTTLEIAFVAARYTPRGEDKGYDLFIETAKALTRAGVNATYHAVGPWDAAIVPLDEIASRLV